MIASLAMKLVSFSPWKHTATSIPSTKEGDDIIQNFVISPSSTITSVLTSKRIKSSKNMSLTSVTTTPSTEMQAVLSLTSNHRISILGHQSSKKILRLPNSSGGLPSSTDEDNTILKEVPQWIYASRPGPTSAFFPNHQESSSSNGSKRRSSTKLSSKTIRHIGSVIDSPSRSIFALQNNNTIMKIWGLDDDVNGPDDDVSNSSIQKVEFDSPILCMNSIPIRRQVRVKIKGQDNRQSNQNHAHGGVAGLLMNGQMFVVLVTIIHSNKRELSVGVFGNNSDSSSHGRRLRSKPQKSSSDFDDYTYLHSIVGFTEGATKSSTNARIGMKRKLDDVGDSDDDSDTLGEITLTAVLRHDKKNDCISFSKHTLVMTSLMESNDQSTNNSDGNSCGHKMIHGDYSKDTGDVKLPHTILTSKANGNGSSTRDKEILVTQLDTSHISVVYQDSARIWYTTVLDTRFGECLIKPFSLRDIGISSNVSRTVVAIAGLSTAILAVLTSDSILTVYDIKRAVKLHEVDVCKVLGKGKNGDKCTFGITAHWFTGTIAIICNTITKGGSHVSVSCARVGVYDTAENFDFMETGKKSFLKGSYNLARIISSSSVTSSTLGKKSLNESNKTHPIELDLASWYPLPKKTSNGNRTSNTDKISNLIIELEKYNEVQQKTSRRKSFLDKFNEIVESLSKTSDKSCKVSGKKLQNGNKSGSSTSLKTSVSVPQSLIDSAFIISANIILNSNNKGSDKINAAKVMIECIKSGMVSGRTHFDTAKISSSKPSDNILRKVLLAVQKESTSQDTHCVPLDLISSILKFCQDGVTEDMLVAMIHFTMCHVTEEQFAQHWQQSSNVNGQYADTGMKLLEKRHSKAKKEYEKAKTSKDERSEDLESLVQHLENRLAVSRQLFFIGKIVTHCQCNPALLRASLRSGLTQSDAGEAELLLLALGKLLRKVGNENWRESARSPNRSTCISQWLSAVMDTHFGMLLSGDHTRTIERVQKEVTASIAQTKTILSLKELFLQVDKMIKNEKKNEGTMVEVTSVPLYGIEPLIF